MGNVEEIEEKLSSKLSVIALETSSLQEEKVRRLFGRVHLTSEWISINTDYRFICPRRLTTWAAK